MSGQRAQTKFTYTCLECRETFTSNVEADCSAVFCKGCFRRHIFEVQGEALRDYVDFGLKARMAGAKLFLGAFRRAKHSKRRKFLALKIFEELMLGSEDLAMLYFALRDRNKRPVLEGLLQFQLNDKTSEEWRQELNRVDDDTILERLGVVASGAPLYIRPGFDATTMLGALREVIMTMRSAASNRTVEGGYLVKGLNKLKHGFIAVSGDDLITPPVNQDEGVAIVSAQASLGRLNISIVEANETKLKELVDTIEIYADAASFLLDTHLNIPTPTPNTSAQT